MGFQRWKDIIFKNPEKHARNKEKPIVDDCIDYIDIDEAREMGERMAALLGVSLEEAFRQLEAGELHGNILIPDLTMVRDFMKRNGE